MWFLSTLKFLGSQTKIFFINRYLFFDNLKLFLSLLGGLFFIISVFVVCKEKQTKFYIFLCAGLNLVIILCFIQTKFLLFYVFFELSLLPTCLLVLIWGAQPERLTAAFYLLSYTALGSFPLLGCVILSYNQFDSFSLILPLFYKSQYSFGLSLMFLCFLAFFIKLPVFGFHLWLTKAHVEAPVIGSMILAGLLLKLGVYGVIRGLKFFSEKNFVVFIIFFWGVFSMRLVSFICFRSIDLKILVAYSSVVHMGLILVSFWKFSKSISTAIVMLCVAHGFCSSGLFFFVNSFYQNSGTRKILLNRGVINISSVVAFFWFLLTFVKASLPPSLNYFSEVFMFNNLMIYSPESIGFIVLIIFLNGLFKVFLFLWIFHGKWGRSNYFWQSMSYRDSLIGLFHCVWLFILPLFINIFWG